MTAPHKIHYKRSHNGLLAQSYIFMFQGYFVSIENKPNKPNLCMEFAGSFYQIESSYQIPEKIQFRMNLGIEFRKKAFDPVQFTLTYAYNILLVDCTYYYLFLKNVSMVIGFLTLKKSTFF